MSSFSTTTDDGLYDVSGVISPTEPSEPNMKILNTLQGNPEYMLRRPGGEEYQPTVDLISHYRQPMCVTTGANVLNNTWESLENCSFDDANALADLDRVDPERNLEYAWVDIEGPCLDQMRFGSNSSNGGLGSAAYQRCVRVYQDQAEFYKAQGYKISFYAAIKSDYNLTPEQQELNNQTVPVIMVLCDWFEAHGYASDVKNTRIENNNADEALRIRQMIGIVIPIYTSLYFRYIHANYAPDRGLWYGYEYPLPNYLEDTLHHTYQDIPLDGCIIWSGDYFYWRSAFGGEQGANWDRWRDVLGSESQRLSRNSYPTTPENVFKFLNPLDQAITTDVHLAAMDA